jgi:hypothetical protein
MRTVVALLLLGALALGVAAPLSAQSSAPPRPGSLAPRASATSHVYGAPIGTRILGRAKRPRRAHVHGPAPAR